MNVVANSNSGSEALLSGTETSCGGGAGRAALDAGGSNALWTFRTGTNSTESESFRSSWQSVLRYFGSELPGNNGVKGADRGGTEVWPLGSPGSNARQAVTGRILTASLARSARQTGNAEDVALDRATDPVMGQLENAASKRPGLSKVLQTTRADEKTRTQSSGGVRTVFADRGIGRDKRTGVGKSGAPDRDAPAKRTLSAGGGLETGVPAQMMIAAPSQVAQPKLRDDHVQDHLDGAVSPTGERQSRLVPAGMAGTHAAEGNGRVDESREVLPGINAGQPHIDPHADSVPAEISEISNRETSGSDSGRLPKLDGSIRREELKNTPQSPNPARDNVRISTESVPPNSDGRLTGSGAESLRDRIRQPDSLSDATSQRKDRPGAEHDEDAIGLNVKAHSIPSAIHAQRKEGPVLHPAGAGLDTAAPIPGTAAMHPPAGASSGNSALSGTTRAGVSSEAFSRLDAEAMAGSPRWIHTDGRQIEAGFEDPALGWVGVHAGLSGGSVHAVLLPGTTQAAEVLGAHMAGLSAHLAEQHAPVATLTLAGQGTVLDGAAPGQDMQQGSGQNGEQDNASHTKEARQADSAAPRERIANLNGISPSILTSDGIRGAHISVTA